MCFTDQPLVRVKALQTQSSVYMEYVRTRSCFRQICNSRPQRVKTKPDKPDELAITMQSRYSVTGLMSAHKTISLLVLRVLPEATPFIFSSLLCRRCCFGVKRVFAAVTGCNASVLFCLPDVGRCQHCSQINYVTFCRHKLS